MATKKKKTSAQPSRLADWAARVKDTAQVCLTIVTLAGVPVGAYVYMLNAISGLRQESRDQSSDLGSKLDTVLAELRGDMKALKERQENAENRTTELRNDLTEDRAERNKDRRELFKATPTKKP